MKPSDFERSKNKKKKQKAADFFEQAKSKKKAFKKNPTHKKRKKAFKKTSENKERVLSFFVEHEEESTPMKKTNTKSSKKKRNATPQPKPKSFFDRIASQATKDRVTKELRSRVKKAAALRKNKKKLTFGRFLMVSFISGVCLVLLVFAVLFIWIGTLRLPNLESFNERLIASSSKIYDRTGEILLFDVHDTVRRTVVPLDKIADDAIDAIVAIEDDEFYTHKGIDFKATARSIVKTGLNYLNIGDYRVQGGSTITQQVIKNTLLTSERRVSRKLKEWFLAPKLEAALTKDQILEHYLNEIPYGGQIYGIETASQTFFGIPASELNLAQSAYLAAIPNAPTLFSPYKENNTRLENRKNLILDRMLLLGKISKADHELAANEEVEFLPRENSFAKAIHFVEYVREQLEEQYGADVLTTGGLSVITSLDYDIQQEAEATVFTHALKNEEAYGASNMGLIALDPKTGEILAMVGSRGYEDEEIDGKFNVTTALRQPGSSFKPFVYAAGMEVGYTDQAVLFDTKTQFSSACEPTNFSRELPCYSPNNFDWQEKGPLTIREALAQSRNIPAVKMAYLVGVGNAIDLAKAMGITSLNKDPNHYGLSIVLGGGEVSLLEMTSAYGVFGNDGIHVDDTAILEVRDIDGEILFLHEPRPRQAMSPESARIISSILSDNVARTPLMGSGSFMNFKGDYTVAVKTGTTNDQRDAWVVGTHPDLAVGVWSGNNDNSPMSKGSVISGPAWRDVMSFGLRNIEGTSSNRFKSPTPVSLDAKPILRGIWEGNQIITIDTVSGKLATEFTPEETRKEIVIPKPHSILHWVLRRNPTGPVPIDPTLDGQYEYWEAGVQKWVLENAPELLQDTGEILIPNEYDDVHTVDSPVEIELDGPDLDVVFSPALPVVLVFDADSDDADIEEIAIMIEGQNVGSTRTDQFTFIPSELPQYDPSKSELQVSATAIDEDFNKKAITFTVKVQALVQ